MAANSFDRSPEARQAEASAQEAMNVIEGANAFADLAASFRDALLAKGFADAPSEMASLQVAAAMFQPPARR